MEKTFLKRWTDPITVPEEILRMKTEYEAEGYSCKIKYGTLVLELQDGTVEIFWQDDAFWQMIHSKNLEKGE